MPTMESQYYVNMSQDISIAIVPEKLLLNIVCSLVIKCFVTSGCYVNDSFYMC